MNSTLFWTSWYLSLQQSPEDVNSNGPFSKNSETHSVNIQLSLLGCATQTMIDDTLLDILIPISFPLKKPNQAMFWYIRHVLHTEQESEAIEC